MLLQNTTKQTVISRDAKIAMSFFDRFLGLIIPRNPRTLIFFTRFGIHTFFLSTAIDILILSSDGRVVIIKNNLQPFHFYFYNPAYKTVIELPQGTISKTKISINDKIVWDEN